MCNIFPHSGGRFTGSADGAYEYTFDNPAQRFGGYFGTNSGTADATCNFYDTAGNLIGTQTASIAADCQWHWNGWDAGTGAKFKRILITGLNPFGGGFVDMDDMEVDTTGGCATPNIYCTAKTNSLGCPAIGFRARRAQARCPASR
jgi:hypothetical protein